MPAAGVWLLVGLAVGGWSCGGESSEVREGRELFRRSCVLCHGPDAEGKSGVAASLVGNPTLAESTDEELAELIRGGLQATDPRNDTGVPMPPRGSSPKLTDDEILKVVTYLRSVG